MNIAEYFRKINDECQDIFDKSLRHRNELGKAHHVSACIYEFAENINDSSERELLLTVSSQIEAATLNVTLGLYRQAYASLRLALEMGLGTVYFSVHKLELKEWLNGKADIKWSSLTDDVNGVLSIRFANAFFKEFSHDIPDFLRKTRKVYRELSEFVHGNNETWEESGIILKYNDDLLKEYFVKLELVKEILIFTLSCRYLTSFPKEVVESLGFISEEMAHIPYIREFFGGPKDINNE